MGLTPTKRAYEKWDNSNGADDFLQLTSPAGAISSWIDSSGKLQGSLLPPATPIGGSPTTWINVTVAPYNAVGDARSITCGVTNTTPNVTSAGLFLASDAGKEIYIYNQSNGNAFTLGTITTVTDTSNIIISGNASQTVGTQQCHIGTNNYTAFHTAELALGTNQVLYIPSGKYMVDDHQILSSGGLASNIGPVTVMGDGRLSTQIWFPPFGTTATTSQVISAGNGSAYWHDLSVRPGPEIATSSSNQNYLVSFYGNLNERVSADNFVATGVPTACLSSGTDGTRMVDAESTGCAIGLYEQWKTVSIINGKFDGTVAGAKLFDFGGQIIGGNYAGAGGGNSTGILNVVQGSPEDWQVIGATITAGPTGCAYSGGANTSVHLIGNTLNYSGITNGSGICLTASTGRAYASGNEIFAGGTGFVVNATGNYYDMGGNKIESIGSGLYTGTGTFNGKVTLTGAAYTNATTTFSNVVGGSGQTFSFNVDKNDVLNVTCNILWQGSAGTTGPKFQWTGPASPTAVAANMHSPVTTSTYLDASATAFSSSMANTGTVTSGINFNTILTLGVQNGANTGAVTLQAAANGAGTLTIQPGSFCIVNA